MQESFYTIPDAPRLALLSDLHNADPAPVISSLRTHRPEIIAITGDVLYGSRSEGDRSPLLTQEHVLPFLSSCVAVAPTFLSLGNHEWIVDSADIKEIEKTGVIVLDNSYQTIRIDGRKIVIGGLTSAYVTDYRRIRSAFPAEPRYPHREDIAGVGGTIKSSLHKPVIDWLSSFAAQPGYKALLSHHPEYWPFIREQKIDLILSGHAHGGQIRLFNHGLWSPGQGWWPRWTKGVYEGRLVVSAGLCNTTWVPRIGNPVEVVYIEPE